MNSRRPLACALVALVIPFALRAQTPRPAAQLHAEICAACHGQKWEGARGPSMLGDTWLHGRDDASLTRSIRDGWVANGMPAFGALLSPEEIRSLVALIGEARAKARRGGVVPPRSLDGVAIASELHNFKLERVADGLVTPWGIAFLPDGRLLVTERPGRLRIVAPGRGIVETISGLPTVYNNNDGGLLDVTVHPDYAHNGWIYLSLAVTGGTEPGASSTMFVRGRIRDGQWVDQETLFRPAPEKFWNNTTHFGSRFLFDRDGFLYFSIGDRGHRPEAQDLASPYGKLHRIRDDGRVPDDNPFVAQPRAIKSIWTWGHRNPQGLAQHPLTGEIWESEHGPRGGDELNVIARGHNYGWPVISYGLGEDGSVFTELTAKEGMEQPVVYWTPSIALGALEFYTGDKFPKWKNQLFGAALVGQRLIRFVLEGHTVKHQELVFTSLGRVRDLATGPDGYLYVSLNSEFANSPGQIVRLVPDEPSAPPPQVTGLDSPNLKPLFDGKTLDGWDCDPAVWTVVDGAMHATGKYGGAFTKTDYGDFRLIVTSRVVTPDGNPGANHLGILFWGEHPEPGKWNMAGALQVQPPHGSMWDYRTNKNVAEGTLTRVVPKPTLSYHDWHVCEILARLATGELRVAVDGVEITRYKHGNPSVLKRGPIGMQLHAAKAEMEYKNILIETDPKEDRLITVK